MRVQVVLDEDLSQKLHYLIKRQGDDNAPTFFRRLLRQEILRDESGKELSLETLEAIREGEEDFKNGRARLIEDFLHKVNEENNIDPKVSKKLRITSAKK